MKIWKPLFLIMMLLLLSGCFSQPLKKVTDPNTPIDRTFYSILPPSGDEWQYMTNERGGSVDLFFGKRFSSTTHTLAATVKEIHSYVKFKDANAFLKYVEQSSMMDVDPRRFNLIDSKFDFKNNLGKYAAYKSATAEDRLAPNSNGKDYLLLKLYGVVVVHPENESIILSFDYSERGTSDEIDPDFEAKARRFLEGIKLK